MKLQTINSFFRSLFTEHLSYKVLSFFIALLLWFVVFNRKDFIVTKDIEVQFVLGPSQTLMTQTADRIRIRLSGPRSLIKAFIESPFSRSIKFDLSGKDSGIYDIEVTNNMIDAPKGVRVLSIRPNLIRVELSSQEGRQ